MLKLPATFDADSCRITLSARSQAAFDSGALKIVVTQLGTQPRIRNFRLDCAASAGRFDIFVGFDDAEVTIGDRVSGRYDIRLWRRASLHIGAGTSCNGARFVCDDSTIRIGADCMFSDEIILQSADQHGIVDLTNGQILNSGPKTLILEPHVWVGRRASVLKNVTVGEGSIIGFGAVVTEDVPPRCAVGGVPARILRRDVTWTREPEALDAYARAAVDRHRP